MYVKVPVNKTRKAIVYYPDTFLENYNSTFCTGNSLNVSQVQENQKILDQYNALDKGSQNKVVETLQVQVDNFKQKIAELQKDFDKKVAENKREINYNCNRKIQTLEKEKQELANRNKLVLDEVQLLKDIKAKHQDTLAKLQSNSQDLAAVNNELARCKQDYQKALDIAQGDLQQKYLGLLSQHRELESQKQNLESQINAVKDENESLKTSMKSNESIGAQQYQSLLDEFNGQKRVYSNLVQKHSECNSDLASTREKLTGVESEYQKVSRLLQDIKQKYENLLGQQSQQLSDSQVLENVKKDLEEKNAQVSADLEQQLQLNKQQIENIKQLQDSIKTLEFDKTQYDKQLQVLNSNLNEKQQDLLRVELLLKDCQNNSTKSSSALQQQLDQQLEAYAKLEGTISSKNQQIDKLEGSLKTCNESLDDYLNNSKKVLEQELANERSKVAALQGQLDSLKEKMSPPTSVADDPTDSKQLQFIQNQKEIFGMLEANLAEKLSKSTDVSSIDVQAQQFITQHRELYYSGVTSDTVGYLYDKIYELKDTLMNLYEDILSAVRVYIRIKGGSDAGESGNNSNIQVVNKIVTSKCQLVDSNYGPFFGVLPSTFNNKDTYTGCQGTKIDKKGQVTSHQVADYQDEKCCILSDTAGFCRVVDQLQSNYHVILFSYGHSGSGKTYTLFGTPEDPGLVQLSLANSGATKFKIDEILELAVGDVDFRSGMRSNNYSKVIKHSPGKYASFIDNNFGNINGILGLLDSINATRIKNKNVLATPNNPYSSRSHLFLKFQLVYPDNHTSKITFCDLGGRESPFELLRMFYNIPENVTTLDFISLLLKTTTSTKSMFPYPKHQFTLDDPLINWFTGNTPNEKQKFVNNLNNVDISLLLKQSVFINETLNHFEYFVNANQRKPFTYSIIPDDSTFYGASLGITERTYDLQKFLVGKPRFDSSYKNSTKGNLDPIKMYSIAADLYGGDPSLKSKIVMICNVRPESRYCKVTNSTLEFANNIKST